MNEGNNASGWTLLGAVLASGLLLLGCANGPTGSSNTSASGGVDSGTETACRRFVELASDYSVLTRSERIEAAQTMEERARASDEPSIREAARNLTESMIDGTATSDDVDQMGDACQQAGALSD